MSVTSCHARLLFLSSAQFKIEQQENMNLIQVRAEKSESRVTSRDTGGRRIFPNSTDNDRAWWHAQIFFFVGRFFVNRARLVGG